MSLGAAVVCGVVAGIGLGWAFDGRPPTTVAAATAPITIRGFEPAARPIPAAGDRGRADEHAVARALDDAIGAAAGSGRMEMAFMLDTATAPLLRPAGRREEMRAWSMIKPVTAVTLLEQPGALADATLDRYLYDALRRSDNCAQRKLTLELERRLGGPAAAQRAIRATLRRAQAGIDVDAAQRNLGGTPTCAASGYPDRLAAKDAAAPVLLLGTTRWHPTDAVAFMHALRGGAYQAEATARVRALLRARKLVSREPGPDGRLSAPASWGAGRAFADPCWGVEYKAGWGGIRQRGFLAGQMGTVELPNGRWAAFAVMFRPKVQPAIDDPGIAGTDVVIERALTRLKRTLRNRFGACR